MRALAKIKQAEMKAQNIADHQIGKGSLTERPSSRCASTRYRALSQESSPHSVSPMS
jgi:hypothetical protein